MQEVDEILYKLGYYDADPQLKQTVQGYIKTAEEFMLDSGVPQERLSTQRARAVKHFSPTRSIKERPTT